MTAAGPLFELRIRVGPDAAAGVSEWLEEVRDQAGQEAGVTDVRAFESRDDDASQLWVLQLQFEDEAAVDECRSSFIANLELQLEQGFGDAVSSTGRLLREESIAELPLGSPNCLNCGARLSGQYCGVCGQRARNRLIRLWELISDAFGDLFELDSRLWRTLIPLLMRPGQLTRDYLEGRRARYMPPFRTYLVLSVIFFVVAFFDPREDLSLLFEPAPDPAPEEQAEREAQAAAAKKELLDELAAEGIIVGNDIPGDAERNDDDIAEPADAINNGFNIQIDDDTGDCNVEAGDLEELPEWFKRRFTPDRIKQVCEKVTADGGKSFVDVLLDNVPVALIVLLPLMALVLKFLYPLSRRYFVEHLLFVIHYHAFFFLILILQILLARVAASIQVPAIGQVLAVVVSLYIPVYLYMAMRHVYGQGRFVTFLKYLALVVAYNIGTAFTMLGAVLWAGVSLIQPA
ncbi:MAG: DUF3667 domain-containing protein [Woeseiaceae bacterium]